MDWYCQYLLNMWYTSIQKNSRFGFAKIIAQGKLLVRVGHKTIGSQIGWNLDSVSRWDSQLPMVEN